MKLRIKLNLKRLTSWSIAIACDCMWLAYGGAITGNHSDDVGGGVAVQKNGSFEMYGGSIAGNFDLALDIRRFDAEYAHGERPNAVIEVSASLIRNDRHQIAAYRVFRASTPAAGVGLGEVAHAFEQSLSQVTGEISGWALQSMYTAR